jgi:HD-GYP domain-containing protein (c-di-GMP phosphodiesterase class II)
MAVQLPVSDDIPREEHECRGYLPIALGTLMPADKLDFDLFVRNDEDRTVLFRGRSYPFEENDIRRLCESRANTLYIRVVEHERYCDYLRHVVLENPDLSGPQRVQVLMAVNRSVFESAFHSPNVHRYLQFAREFGEELTTAICDSEIILSVMIRLMSHDYYTYTHVANVTTYCLALACGLGIKEREILQQITIGGLLHDYGKRFVPKSILNSRGRLTDEQWVLIQQHPTTGFRDFSLRNDISWGQLMMVYQHHERPDGKGYPVGIGGSEIHDWAKMCKLVDVFESLTSDRPYRRADSVSKVMEFMRAKAGTEFDPEMVRCFQAMINCED